jgi:hypothetical protein
MQKKLSVEEEERAYIISAPQKLVSGLHYELNCERVFSCAADSRMDQMPDCLLFYY